MGPNDYTFSAIMKLAGPEGGIVFRVQPVKVDGTYHFWKYYYAAVNRYHYKLRVYYVHADPDNPEYEKIAESEVPMTEIDLTDWFSLSVTVKGNNIKVAVEDKTLIDVNDDRLTFGTVGVCSSSHSTYFDSVAWSAYISGGETVAVTTTLPGTGVTTITMSKTETVTTTGVGSTVTTTLTETSTVTEPGETTIVYSVVTRTLSSVATKTVTTVSRQVVRRVVTKTVEHTVTETYIERPRCLIATAAFGSEIVPQVQLLREFRDGFVMRTFAGENFMKAFNAFYYSWSPYVAQAEYENPTLRNLIKLSIYPLLFSLEISKHAAEPLLEVPELAVLVSGLVASSLIGLIYLAPIIVSALLVLGWRGRRVNVRLVYPVMALMTGLMLFTVAEAFASPLLMIFASSVIVLSAVALGAIVPAKMLSIWSERRSAQ